MSDPLADPTSRHYRLLAVMSEGAQDPEEYFRRASELGIFPTVRDWAKDTMDVSVCEPGWKRHLIAHSVRQRALADVIQELDVPFVVLKGLALGRELYGDPRLRESADIDLLVDQSDLDEVVAGLEALGYASHSNLDPAHNREVELVHRDTGMLIDVHWRIAFPWVPAPQTSDLLASRTRLIHDQMSIPVLARKHRLIHLMLHFHDHVGFAKGLLDIAAFLDVHGLEAVDESFAELKSLGLSGVASWPLYTLEQLEVGEIGAVRRTASVELWARWSASAMQGVLGLSEPIGARHPASFKIGEITSGEQVLLKAATMALLDRKRDRVRAMTYPVVSSPAGLAAKEGRDRTSALDWARWAARPAELITRQLRQMSDGKEP